MGKNREKGQKREKEKVERYIIIEISVNKRKIRIETHTKREFRIETCGQAERETHTKMQRDTHKKFHL